MSVSDLVGRLGITIGNMSQHLNMMKQRWVLVSRKEGNMVFYRLANPKMLKAFDLIRREPIGADRARKSPIEERIMPLVELENVSMKPEGLCLA